jgi:hypothetical protein
MLRGLLFLHLGGAHVTDLAHQPLGHPGESTLRHSTTVTTISPCAGMPTQMEIHGNIEAIFQGTDLSDNYGYVLMVNEIKLEECPRCVENTQGILTRIFAQSRSQRGSSMIFLHEIFTGYVKYVLIAISRSLS